MGSHIVVTDQNNEQLLDNGNILDNRLLIGGGNSTIINNRILSDASIPTDTNILPDRIILSDGDITGKYLILTIEHKHYWFSYPSNYSRDLFNITYFSYRFLKVIL